METAPCPDWHRRHRHHTLKQVLKASVLVNQRHGLGSALCHMEGRVWSIFLQQVQDDPANRRSFHCPASAEIQKQRQKLSEEPAIGRRELTPPSVQLQ